MRKGRAAIGQGKTLARDFASVARKHASRPANRVLNTMG